MGIRSPSLKIFAERMFLEFYCVMTRGNASVKKYIINFLGQVVAFNYFINL